jgi:hypothetical protein
MKHTANPIFKLPLQIDREHLLGLLREKDILNRMTAAGTISLMHRPGTSDPWFDGITKIALLSGEDIPFSENDFKIFNPGLEATYFETCHQLFDQALLGRLGRVRLFRRLSQTTSSLHRDLDVRLHVALETNINSFLVFPDIGVFQIPADNHIYLVNTTIRHFAVNTDPTQERLHLVCSSYCGFLEHRTNEDRILSSNRELFRQIVEKYSASEIAPICVR